MGLEGETTVIEINGQPVRFRITMIKPFHRKVERPTTRDAGEKPAATAAPGHDGPEEKGAGDNVPAPKDKADENDNMKD